MVADEPPLATPHPPRKALPPFEALRAFDAVARLGGVRRAAQYLGRDHAVVSRHLRTIEEWTGARLIERTPGGALLTEDGIRYHRQIALAIDTIANATVDLMRRNDNHRLHIRCMPGFALHWLSPRLGDFQQTNPGLDVEVRPTDRGEAVLADHADIDIRFVATYGVGIEVTPEMKVLEFARAPVMPVASPAYLARSPSILTPGDLLAHQLLHEEDFVRWRTWLAALGVEGVEELTGPRLWQGHLTLEAARYGRGIALTNPLVAADDIKEGRLVEIGTGLEGFSPLPIGVWRFIARADRWDARLIRRFRNWLIAAVQEEHPQLAVATDTPA